MIKEFKDFVNRGNLVEMAVAFVLGTAFAALVTSFVDNILMQLVAVIFGQPDFAELTATVNDAEIYYGAFINAAVTFVFVAIAMFLVVKAYNRMKKDAEEEEAAGPDEVELLTQIRDALKSRS